MTDDIIQQLKEYERLCFTKEDKYEEFFGNPERYELFKIALNNSILRIEILFDTRSYNVFVKWLTIFKESGLYNYTSFLNLDIQKSNNSPSLILEPELNTLAELVATSQSFNGIRFDHFKLTAAGTIIFFDAINKNNNIKTLIFESGDYRIHEIIFDRISCNRTLRTLILHDRVTADNLNQLFINLRINNSSIEILYLSFKLTNQTFESLIDFLESDNKLIILRMGDMNLTDIDDKLCDRYWLIVHQKKLLIYTLVLETLTARKIQNLNLDNIDSLIIKNKNNDDSNMVITAVIIEKLKLKEGLLKNLSLSYNVNNDFDNVNNDFDNDLTCQLIALDKCISLYIPFNLRNTDIESFYKILPSLENLDTLCLGYVNFYYIFSDNILAYLKYNISLTQANIHVKQQSRHKLKQILSRNKHNKKVNSMTLIDILKQYKK